MPNVPVLDLAGLASSVGPVGGRLRIGDQVAHRDEARRPGLRAYCINRGRAKEVPIKTQSRIDILEPGATLQAGSVSVSGVAWAFTRGIDRVEVSADGRDLARPRLASQLDADAQRQYVYAWEVEPGERALKVRPTDGEDGAQIEEELAPSPPAIAPSKKGSGRISSPSSIGGTRVPNGGNPRLAGVEDYAAGLVDRETQPMRRKRVGPMLRKVMCVSVAGPGSRNVGGLSCDDC